MTTGSIGYRLPQIQWYQIFRRANPGKIQNSRNKLDHCREFVGDNGNDLYTETNINYSKSVIFAALGVLKVALLCEKLLGMLAKV